MKIYKGLLGVLGVALLASCIEHEVIEKPTEEVDLNPYFICQLEGSPFELIKDVDGYDGESRQVVVYDTIPDPSTVQYYYKMSGDQPEAIEIGIGKLNFNASGVNERPDLGDVLNYLEGNMMPDFSDTTENGVEVLFTDGSGHLWRTSEMSAEPQFFQFTSLEEESDSSGDYVKFVAQFSCELYDSLEALDIERVDTIRIDGATLEGYFKVK